MTAAWSRLSTRACAAVLVAAGLAAVAAPATATSASLRYDCASPDFGPQVFTAVIDTDAPATLGADLSAAIKTTSTVTIPEPVADGLRALSASYVLGSASATGTVDGVNRVTSLTISNTPVPPDGTTMQVVGAGPSGSITAGAVGTTILLGAGSFTATVTAYSSTGSSLATYAFNCTPQVSQNLLVDTVSVVPTPTTTTITAQTPIEYGATLEVSAVVDAPGLKAKPSGTLEFAFQGKTVKVEVKGGRAKATLARALAMGSQPVSAKFTPTNARRAASEATKVVTVVKGQTTTSVTAFYREERHRVVSKATVVALNGTEVAGEVKFVLRRNGVKIRTAIVELNTFDKARKVFTNISRAGTYRVVARYRGSDTLKRSVDRLKLNV